LYLVTLFSSIFREFVIKTLYLIFLILNTEKNKNNETNRTTKLQVFATKFSFLKQS
jgi:hypothetical protein